MHILRQTQAKIVIGPSPSPAAEGQVQQAGRLVWEAAAAAADPGSFPERLTGPDAVATWQVSTILAGGGTQGSGGVAGPNCQAGFIPASTNPFTVVGT